MGVYERAYRRYEGPLTAERRRFLIVPRYAFGDVFRSRLFTAFYTLCFGYPLVCAVLIYLHYNASALKILELDPSKLLSIDEKFFLFFLRIQGNVLGFLVTLVVGPSLVSPDLRSNGLALYLSRPFSRTEYVAGKMTVLVVLLSAITWIPGVLLFLLQAYLGGSAWMGEHPRILPAVLLSSWIWIVLLSLLALAVSATVKWKPVASAALIAVFFVAAALGATLNQVLGVRWGSVLNLGLMLETVWSGLFGLPVPAEVPVGAAWVSLAVASAISLWLLARKVRAYEVVR